MNKYSSYALQYSHSMYEAHNCRFIFTIAMYFIPLTSSEIDGIMIGVKLIKGLE